MDSNFFDEHTDGRCVIRRLSLRVGGGVSAGRRCSFARPEKKGKATTGGRKTKPRGGGTKISGR